ncbi:MAG: DNA repair protein RadA [Crocinitomicaceae bacterium]
MSKVKTAFFCQECGYESPKWIGKCMSCGSWNTMVEEISSKPTSPVIAFSRASNQKSVPKTMSEIVAHDEERYVTKDKEFNRVLGGGIVPGSLILFGGEPGIGKSTLLLQICISEKMKVLYVSGEESEQQIKMRADRIGVKNEECFILTETNTQQIFKQIELIQPQLVIIDSIQTLHSELIESTPGSISQIKECTSEFLRFAKETQTPVLLIGHITKEGSLAGPKVLEHMVDTVLHFEGDRNHFYRLLRGVKNRFGSTNELGIYEMQGTGLRQVENPSEILISSNPDQLSGVAIAATLEGVRPILIEVQALVSTAAYGTPQRSSTGFDLRRLNMLLAVLEKRCGFKLGAKDVFLNLAGGIKVDDPAIDLAVVAAILSSNADVSIPKDVCLSAEIGLSGEIRPVNRIEQRIFEAQKLGFTKMIVSSQNKGLSSISTKTIEVIPCSKIEQVLKALFS